LIHVLRALHEYLTTTDGGNVDLQEQKSALARQSIETGLSIFPFLTKSSAYGI